MIKHIVMWSFEEGKEETAIRFLEEMKGLYGVIPEIKKLEIGMSCNKNNNFAAVLISEFESLEALERFKKDSRHIKAGEIGKSVRKDRGAVDFEFI